MIVFPPDPDCPKCKGMGLVNDQGPKSIGGFADCDCRKAENLFKWQNKCQHIFICQKCGLELIHSKK